MDFCFLAVGGILDEEADEGQAMDAVKRKVIGIVHDQA